MPVFQTIAICFWCNFLRFVLSILYLVYDYLELLGEFVRWAEVRIDFAATVTAAVYTCVAQSRSPAPRKEQAETLRSAISSVRYSSDGKALSFYRLPRQVYVWVDKKNDPSAGTLVFLMYGFVMKAGLNTSR